MIASLLVTLCTAATVTMLVALARATRPRAGAVETPPITVLKPLCGADDALAANLATFFAQDYPAFELLFGVADAADPAIAVVERLIAANPRVAARLVVHDGARALNPKVANLRGMLAAGAHDVVVISDSNVAVDPGYLRSLAARLEPGVGLVTSLLVGDGERSLGARLEGLHVTGCVAGSVAAAELAAGNALVVGKSLLFRRSIFERLGGLESLGAVLAEDYVMGRMFTEAGLAVRAATAPVRNVVVRSSTWTFVRRLARWALLRSRLKPLLYPLEPLATPVAVALVALALGAPPALIVPWAVATTLARDAGAWLILRGRRGLATALLGIPKDLLVIAAWLAAPWKRRVSWRGRRFRVSAGTRLFAQAR